jgi:hypothetical protein
MSIIRAMVEMLQSWWIRYAQSGAARYCPTCERFVREEIVKRRTGVDGYEYAITCSRCGGPVY